MSVVTCFLTSFRGTRYSILDTPHSILGTTCVVHNTGMGDTRVQSSLWDVSFFLFYLGLLWVKSRYLGIFRLLYWIWIFVFGLTRNIFIKSYLLLFWAGVDVLFVFSVLSPQSSVLSSRLLWTWRCFLRYANLNIL